jgi:hypothetical protein
MHLSFAGFTQFHASRFVLQNLFILFAISTIRVCTGILHLRLNYATTAQ